MKKICSVLLFSICLAACKKDKDSSPLQKLISNSTWSGEFKYTSHTYNDPYSIVFSPNGNFTWYEFGFASSGTYKLDEASKKITVTFSSSGESFAATITSDNKLTGFSYGGSYNWAILGGELNATANQDLVNTVWKVPTLSFQSASSLIYTDILGTTYTVPYSRAGGTINFILPSGLVFFGVIKGNSIKGIFNNGGGGFAKWEVTKQ